MLKNRKHSEESKLKMSLSAKLRGTSFKGKHHTDETKKRLSEYKGSKNSQFGKDHSGSNNGMNVVLEYDSKYHNSPKQKHKDLVRQNKIVEILKPTKFWRYNSESKTVENVIV